MTGPRLRPLGMGDLFDEGFDLYKRNFVLLLLVTAITVVPLDILLAYFEPRLMERAYEIFGVAANQSDGAWLWLISAMVKLTIYLPLYAIALGPVVIAASDSYLQTRSGTWQTVKSWLKRSAGLILCCIITGALLGLGLGMCLVGWPIAASLLLFTLQAYLLEKLGPFQAMKRSSALANGYAGRVFATLLMLGVMLWVIGLGVKLPLAYLFENILNIGPGSGSDTGQVVTMLSNGLSHLLLFPFLVSVLTALYYDLRIRKEGFDIDLLASELGYPALAATGPYLPPVLSMTVLKPVALKRHKKSSIGDNH